MLASTLLIAALAPLLASAQSSVATGTGSTNTTGLPSCAITCTISSLAGTACSTPDPACLCTNTQFQAAFFQCQQQACSPSDLQAALAFGARTCEENGTPIDTAATPSGVTAASTGASSASSAAASSMSQSSMAAPSSAASSAAAAGTGATAAGSAPSSAASAPASGAIAARPISLAAVGVTVLGAAVGIVALF